MSAIVDAAMTLAAELSAAGVPAFVDIRDVAGNLPCVLVPPPILDGIALDGSASFGWRLVAIAGNPLGSLVSFEEIAELVDNVAGVLPIERAEPIQYQLPSLVGSGEPLPAYLITITGS